MKVGFKLTYAQLISHTFPGLLLALEIALAFCLFVPGSFNKNMDICKNPNNFSCLLILLIIIYIVSTLLGIVIDAIHHCFFRNDEKEAMSTYGEIYRYIKDKDQLAIYDRIERDNWYYYEAYANIAISLALGLIIYFFLFFQKPNFLIFIIISIIYIVIIYMLYSEAKHTLIIAVDIEKKFLENLKSRNNTGLEGSADS